MQAPILEDVQGRLRPGEQAPVDPTRSTFDHDYWLARCVGFTVTSPQGRRLGRVAWLQFGSQLGRPDALAVRSGLLRRRLQIVPCEAIERVLPHDRQLVLRSLPGRSQAAAGS